MPTLIVKILYFLFILFLMGCTVTFIIYFSQLAMILFVILLYGFLLYIIWTFVSDYIDRKREG